MPKERVFMLEGVVAQTVVVLAKGTTLEEAVARAESGHYEIDEELKLDFRGWSWTEDTDVQVSENGIDFLLYEPPDEGEMP